MMLIQSSQSRFTVSKARRILTCIFVIVLLACAIGAMMPTELSVHSVPVHGSEMSSASRALTTPLASVLGTMLLVAAIAVLSWDSAVPPVGRSALSAEPPQLSVDFLSAMVQLRI